VKLSVIVATRNRASAITPCLESIAASIAHAALLDAEIVVVDNGSTDNTAEIVRGWAASSGVPVEPLSEPLAGKSHALNRALRAARGELLAFTDDDCRWSKDYVSQLLRYDESDGNELVLRGGRVELGDTTDLPLSIKIAPSRLRFSLRMDPATNPTRHDCIIPRVSGNPNESLAKA
jgi:glycosyltransferase involved in cell wall biosynthesis